MSLGKFYTQEEKAIVSNIVNQFKDNPDLYPSIEAMDKAIGLKIDRPHYSIQRYRSAHGMIFRKKSTYKSRKLPKKKFTHTHENRIIPSTMIEENGGSIKINVGNGIEITITKSH